MTVSGLTGPVTDVDVRLGGLTHEWAADLDLLLVGPLGQQVTLMSDTGLLLSGVDLTLDDEASKHVPAGSFTSGRYLPTDVTDPTQPPDSYPEPAPATRGSTSLAAFDGTDPNGVWRLFAVDDYRESSMGLLDSWSLDIETVPPTSTATPTPTVTATDTSTSTPTATATATPTATATATGTPTATATANGHVDLDRHAHDDGHRDLDRHADGHRNLDRHADADGHRDLDGHADADRDHLVEPHRDGNPWPDQHGRPHLDDHAHHVAHHRAGAGHHGLPSGQAGPWEGRHGRRSYHEDQDQGRRAAAGHLPHEEDRVPPGEGRHPPGQGRAELPGGVADDRADTLQGTAPPHDLPRDRQAGHRSAGNAWDERPAMPGAQKLRYSFTTG
jgi:subtilisin-like proprotein convertase family protein